MYIRLAELCHFARLQKPSEVKKKLKLICVPLKEINPTTEHSLLPKNSLFVNLFEFLFLFATISNLCASLNLTKIMLKLKENMFYQKYDAFKKRNNLLIDCFEQNNTIAKIYLVKHFPKLKNFNINSNANKKKGRFRFRSDFYNYQFKNHFEKYSFIIHCFSEHIHLNPSFIVRHIISVSKFQKKIVPEECEKKDYPILRKLLSTNT